MRFSRNASYELRVHWTWTDGVMALAGVGLLCGAGWGVVAVEALETGQGIGAVALATALGVLLVFAGTAAFHGPATRLRVDASGVGFTRGRWRSRTHYDVIAWEDVEAFVTWKGKSNYWVGVAASEAHRRRKGLGRTRFDRWLDKTVGLPVSGTVTIWIGPAHELRALHDTVASLAPHVPCFNPTDDTNRRRLRPDLA
ncbi:hypothetical protein QI554_35960 [Yinghuangia seranimata]|nr:hypothetical protein [Yinghuangia seranimata]